MAFQTVRDILDHARSFHRKLADFYALKGEHADKELVRVLLNYMSRHERHLDECLSSYEKESAKRILETWFKYPPEMPECACFECIELKPDLSAKDLFDTAMKVDQCLVNLYRQAAERAVSSEVKALFAELLELEKREETECLRNALTYALQA